MVEIELDGLKVEVPEGSTVMQAADKVGMFIPHFCYHKKLSIAASCRMCLVEVEKAPKVLPACATPVTQGMVVHTKSEKAVAAQKAIMEFLLINHPLDCPICDQGGECLLQDQAVGYGGTKSRYTEEKRVVFHKNAGPLISMEEMSRCIQCTRCVRFGQEISGVMELGMINRGERSEITTFVGKTIDSELSGNMIDVCPVGALTSKPFRYSARTWELSRRKSVSPHDSTGANLTIQVKGAVVKRVVPLENEAVNECWIADRDRFSYQALSCAERLSRPMLKQDGRWHEVEWPVALDYVMRTLKDIAKNHGAKSVGALASPHATLEELFLLGRVMREFGSDNVDYRLRHADFTLGNGAQWLGRSIASLNTLNSALIVGSFLCKDHPLFAQRLRQAANKNGAQLFSIHAVADEWHMPVAGEVIVAPSKWLQMLANVAQAVAQEKGIQSPFAGGMADAVSIAIAKALASGENKAVLLGNMAAQHPQASQLLAVANWIAAQTGATSGYLTADANTVGAQIAKAMPQTGGANAAQMLGDSLRGYVLLGVEPELDTANPAKAFKALKGADTVICLSAFKSETMFDYADALLPVSPFTETAGTFINAEGRVQSFHGVVPPLGETRPAWKVLRVLADMLELPGLAFNSAEEVREAALLDLNMDADSSLLGSGLSNEVNAAVAVDAAQTIPAGLYERVAQVPIYCTDSLVRRASALQATQDGRAACAVGVPAVLWGELGLKDGARVRVTQGECQMELPAVRMPGLADRALHIPTGHPLMSALGAMFGPVAVAKA